MSQLVVGSAQFTVLELQSLKDNPCTDIRREPLAQIGIERGRCPVEEVATSEWLAKESRRATLDADEPMLVRLTHLNIVGCQRRSQSL